MKLHGLTPVVFSEWHIKIPRYTSGDFSSYGGTYCFGLSSFSNPIALTPKYTTSAITIKSIAEFMKLPHNIFTGPNAMAASLRFPAAPSATPRRGFTISVMSELTTFDTAPPRMNPTASPTTPCSRMKLKNPFME